MKFFEQFKGLRPTRLAHILGGVGLVLAALGVFFLWVALAAENYHG